MLGDVLGGGTTFGSGLTDRERTSLSGAGAFLERLSQAFRRSCEEGTQESHAVCLSVRVSSAVDGWDAGEHSSLASSSERWISLMASASEVLRERCRAGMSPSLTLACSMSAASDNSDAFAALGCRPSPCTVLLRIRLGLALGSRALSRCLSSLSLSKESALFSSGDFSCRD